MKILYKNIISRLCMLAIVFILFPRAAHTQDIREVKIGDLQKIISESKRPLLVNFWATWCRPCIEEIPYFQQTVNAYAKDSVQLILVSVDYKEEFPMGIRATAEKRNFQGTILWLNETDADYFCPRIDQKWSGAVPATLFINNRVGYRKFFEEQLSREKLNEEIMAILKAAQ